MGRDAKQLVKDFPFTYTHQRSTLHFSTPITPPVADAMKHLLNQARQDKRVSAPVMASLCAYHRFLALAIGHTTSQISRWPAHSATDSWIHERFDGSAGYRRFYAVMKPATATSTQQWAHARCCRGKSTQCQRLVDHCNHHMQCQKPNTKHCHGEIARQRRHRK